MTRALNSKELSALTVGRWVLRIPRIGDTEVGKVERVTPCTLVVQWQRERVRYNRATGSRLGCRGEVLRAVHSPAPVVPDYLQF